MVSTTWRVKGPGNERSTPSEKSSLQPSPVGSFFKEWSTVIKCGSRGVGFWRFRKYIAGGGKAMKLT